MHDLADTICALSTAPGRAGMAVVRVSGVAAFTVSEAVLLGGSGDFPPRRAVLRQIVDHDREHIDEAIVTSFPGPHSYTGEDVVEISLHGSPVLVGFVLDALCGAGARLAEPGEFTMRAFLRGRMDLMQAEAVNDIIQAVTLYQARVAERQRSGELSGKLAPLKRSVVDAIVQLESAVEFAEHDIPTDSRDEMAGRLQSACAEIGRWIESFRRGRLVREGFSLAVVGRANVGKSSVFNALLADDRSIVTEMPGTTRDLVSESTNLDGIPVRLLDTAGVRTPQGKVEELGIDRSYRAMADADASLLVVDSSISPAPEDFRLRQRLADLPVIVVLNKSDLPCAWTDAEKGALAGAQPAVDVSALTGTGIEDLKAAILQRLFGSAAAEQDGVLVTNLRHCRCLESARAHLEQAAGALSGNISEEFALVGLHGALSDLGAITGETGVEDILGEIFSRFCVGK